MNNRFKNRPQHVRLGMTWFWLIIAPAWVGVATGTPSVGAETPDTDLEAIDTFLKAHLEATPLPGFAVVIVKGERTIFQKGYGVESVGSTRPLTPQSSLAIGSLMKSLTAVAVMQLVEQGKVGLDAPVTHYVPWFRTASGRQEEITIRRLLHNTSGISSRDQWHYRDTSEEAIEQSVRELSGLPLTREPGKSFEYANENWLLLGLVIAEVSGMPYSDYMQERVFRPLAMSRSTTARERFEEIGVLYGHVAGVAELRPAPRRFIGEAVPAGSEMRASAEDLGHYLAMLLGDGVFRDARLLKKESVDALFEPGISCKVHMPEMGVVDSEAAYAMGWFLAEVDGRAVVHHSGDAITMGSWTMLDRQKKLAVSVLFNGPALDTYRFRSKLWLVNNLLHLAAGEPTTDFGMPLGKDPTANDFEPPADTLSKYSGTFLSADGHRAEVTSSEGAASLIVRTTRGVFEEQYSTDFLSESAVALRNLSGARVASFLLTAEGEVTGLVGGLAGGVYRRRSPQESARLVRFTSPDGSTTLVLPPTWQVRWDEDSFEVASDLQADVVLRGGFGEAWKMTAENAALAAGSVGTTELIGGRSWTKHVWNESPRQSLLVFTDTAHGRFYVLLTTGTGRITTPVREVLVPMLSEITFDPVPRGQR